MKKHIETIRTLIKNGDYKPPLAVVAAAAIQGIENYAGQLDQSRQRTAAQDRKLSTIKGITAKI